MAFLGTYLYQLLAGDYHRNQKNGDPEVRVLRY
jgi:hypothetical protein